jgi:prophage regulatory protein
MGKKNLTILRLPEVEKKTGARKPTIYRWIRQDAFPLPIKIGVRAVGWIEGEVDNWIESRPRAEIIGR